MVLSPGTRTGRCTNIGNCDLADSRALVEVKPGADFICSECGKPLMVMGGGNGSSVAQGRLPRWALAALAGVFVVVLCFATWRVLFGGTGGLAGPTPILRLGGSNTIGDKLGPALAEGWLKSLGCDDVTTTHPEKDETALGCKANGKALLVTVGAHGTETGFNGLKDDKYDLAMASDKIDSKTTADLSDLGDMGSDAAEHVIGFDGVAIIVNRSNGVQQLTLDQVAGLFSGEISDWSQVGGTPGPVHVYTRDKKSGTRKFVERKVLKGEKTVTPSAKEYEKGTELADAVASDLGGIGFVGAASAEVAKVVSLVAAEGSAPYVPTDQTIRTQDYALSRPLFLYQPPKHINPEAASFLAFVNSTGGEKIVKSSGFTPLTIQFIRPQPAPANAPPLYVATTSAANRLSFNYSFKTNSSELSNLAVSDLSRLANFIAQNNVSASHIMLIGFTDDQGPNGYNSALSKRRAASVANELRRSGVAVNTILGFGKALPIASNATEEGRNLNRRVEVWVKQ